MDELNQLKDIWQRSFEKEPESIDQDKIFELISKKSSGPVGRLKKSIRIEIAAILVAIPLLVAIMFELKETYFLVNTSLLILLFAGSMVYYFVSLQRLEKIWKKSQYNIRKSIESTLMLVKFFRNVYFWLNIIMFPFGIYFGYIIGFGLGSGGRRVTSLPYLEDLPFLMSLALVCLFVFLLFVLFRLFLKFYMKKLYDVHIEKLEKLQKELSEFE